MRTAMMTLMTAWGGLACGGPAQGPDVAPHIRELSMTACGQGAEAYVRLQVHGDGFARDAVVAIRWPGEVEWTEMPTQISPSPPGLDPPSTPLTLTTWIPVSGSQVGELIVRSGELQTPVPVPIRLDEPPPKTRGPDDEGWDVACTWDLAAAGAWALPRGLLGKEPWSGDRLEGDALKHDGGPRVPEGGPGPRGHLW